MRFNSWQLRAFGTLFFKELLRFWKVSLQTIAAPILNALLWAAIFSHLLEQHATRLGEVAYEVFLAPGLVMMSILQNAFANSSSSLIQSRITGSLVFVLVTPISHASFFFAYVLAALVRGFVVGVGVFGLMFPFVKISPAHLGWAVVFALLGAWMMGALGVVAGIWSEKFDHLAAFQNFFVTPLTMLAGVFYSLASLPSHWQLLMQLNPFFYFVDGFRFGFLGISEVSPWYALGVSVASAFGVSVWAYGWIASGYKLRG